MKEEADFKLLKSVRKNSLDDDAPTVEGKSTDTYAHGYICSLYLCQEITANIESYTYEQRNDKQVDFKRDRIDPLIHDVGNRGKHDVREQCRNCSSHSPVVRDQYQVQGDIDESRYSRINRNQPCFAYYVQPTLENIIDAIKCH